MADTRRKVILVTDGDKVAKRTVEVAAKNVGARCISASWGNPTDKSGSQLVQLIKQAAHDPIVVMLDDRGDQGTGKGEKALKYIFNHPEIEVLGVVAVASNTPATEGVRVLESITREGEIIGGAVDKLGYPDEKHHNLKGDTVDVLNQLEVTNIVGVGDIGKMDGKDDRFFGAPITTKALQEILDKCGEKNEQR